MTLNNQPINSHIIEYLHYYCNLPTSPEFAILLKGKWGCGKTWLINKYREKFENKNQKFLYVSLYGMTTFSEIEYTLFQQLHPLLSSKGMALTGKILKGFLKGTLKIDWDGDSKNDGMLNLQIPEINLPEYLKNTDKNILIFDDLERCKIDINNLLGYINFFVEIQGLKVITIGNEDQLFKPDDNDSINSYKAIKEKLIGKTFEVSPDFNSALTDFIEKVTNSELKDFLKEKRELIQNLYHQSKYENLRSLKHIILDFERIFSNLPEKAKTKPELLQEVLTTLMIFSIEIKRATILAADISSLSEVDLFEINLYSFFPSLLYWKDFFDKGIINSQELERSMSNSKYFHFENTPNWVRLWHGLDLSDDEFEDLIKKVELEYSQRQFIEIMVIRHILGMFLLFSDIGLYDKSKEEILKDSKLYIDYLKNESKLDLIIYPWRVGRVENKFNDYNVSCFKGIDFPEFKEFSSYIKEIQEIAIEENLPIDGKNLLNIMQSDVIKFRKMISPSWQDSEISDPKYHNLPILKYIAPDDFLEKLLSLKPENQRYILFTLKERYSSANIDEKLLEELEWLKLVQNLLLDKANQQKGKLSGYWLELLNTNYLNEAIKKLEELDEKIKSTKTN